MARRVASAAAFMACISSQNHRFRPRSASLAVEAFSHIPPSALTNRKHNIRHASYASLKLSTNGDGGDRPVENAGSLADKAKRAVLEADKMEAELTLTKIDKLEKKSMREISKSDGSTISSVREEIEVLAKKIDPSLVKDDVSFSSSAPSKAISSDRVTTRVSSSLLPPPEGLTQDELEAACVFYTSLPITMRSALASAVGYENQETLTGLEIRDVVIKLYERRDTLSATKLRELYKETLEAPLSMEQGIDEILEEVKGMLANPDEMRLEAAVDTQLPRQVRKEGTCPKEADVNAFFREICGKSTFLAAEKPIRAGELWVIRGKSQTKDPSSLVEAIDKMLDEKAPGWSDQNQYCYIMDPSLEEGEEDLFGDPVIIIANKDMAPSISPIVTLASTVTALSMTFLFCLGAYGGNELIMKRLNDANEIANNDLSWFNELLLPFLGAFFFIQASHDLAQVLVAQRDKMKVTPPIVVPSLGLPYLTSLTRFKTAPKDYNSLFDYGFAGPVTGLVVAFGTFVLGLQLTVSVDPETAKYLPSLPVEFIKLSKLGGTLVDQFVGGGAGILLEQDPSTAIPLHPFAIAGFVGLIINALDLIPIGSTDGARMSQALVGRVGQTVVGGGAYLVLLVALVFLDQRDVFLSYCLINSVIQRDLEVPCKNEVDRPELGRAAAALAAYFVAALIVVPM